MVVDLSNLPGFERIYNDFNLQVNDEADYQPNTGVVTDGVLLIGTAVDGPVEFPVSVRRLTEAEDLFGGMVAPNGLPNEMSLIRGMRELYAAGCRDIRLMRIGGTFATGELLGQETVQTVVSHIRETIGQVSGSEETVITISLPANSFLVPDSVLVKVDNEPQTFGYTVDYSAAKVTFQPGWFNTGANVYIGYQYDTEIATHEVTNEPLVKDTATTFYLQHGPLVYGTLSVYVDGTEMPATSLDGLTVYWTYDEASNKITFVEAPSGAVTANYTYKELQRSSGYVTGKIGGSTQSFTLSYVPIADSVVLYANKSALPKTAYTVNATDKKVFLQPGYADMLATVEAEYNYSTTSSFIPKLEFRGIYPGAVYNGTMVTLEVPDETPAKAVISFKKPAGKGGQDFSLYLANYPTLGKLVDAINNDQRNRYLRVSTNAPDMPAGLLKGATVVLAGGTDGPKPSDYDYKEKMYDLLSHAYELLMDYNAAFVVPLDVYADDPASGNRNFAEQLANFCAAVSMANSETLGIIGVKPVADISLETLKNKVDSLCASGSNQYFLKDANGDYIYDDKGNLIDVGRFISVVAGPEVVTQNEQIGLYATSPATFFAGLISMLPPHVGALNRTVTGALGLRFSYSLSQQNRLTAARYVTLRTRPGSSNVIVTDAPTAAVPDSDYRRLTTMRVVATAVGLVRLACEPFVGLPNSPENRGAMATAITSKLQGLQKEGAILDFKFQIFASTKDQLLGHALIDLTIYPALELTKISTTVTLRPPVNG
ncbi:hypothetical protein MTAT_20540 [Moorella thermoacetica]|uniref:Phage tail sheath protein n=1 Tax=Neomoorella thermoacetica TaxID=1525 RepID=A0AAC9HIS8_NEOTH|nr:DUF2586 family protein [Moorella thermoacetica]AOQ24709.1 Phage tail sheath protein [Moorella thermoacetica]TYL12812.1 hypothetical protein MTAT_20540 [Moorella thermoacetica]